MVVGGTLLLGEAEEPEMGLGSVGRGEDQEKLLLQFKALSGLGQSFLTVTNT